MSKLLIGLLFFATTAQAATSSDSLHISGVVPVVLQATLTRTSDLTFTVHETSNNPHGYRLMMETDSKRAEYDNQPVNIIEGQAVLTETLLQEQTVDVSKSLVFTSKPSFVRIIINAI